MQAPLHFPVALRIGTPGMEICGSMPDQGFSTASDRMWARWVDMILRSIACVILVSSSAFAADVGGWMAEQQKAAMRDVTPPASSTCTQVIARAVADPNAPAAYHAAQCYLRGESPDLVSAKVWLTRSAELNFLPAQRQLRSLVAAEAAAHSAARHCHDLGEGRQICHGSAPLSPVATPNPN